MFSAGGNEISSTQGPVELKLLQTQERLSHSLEISGYNYSALRPDNSCEFFSPWKRNQLIKSPRNHVRASFKAMNNIKPVFLLWMVNVYLLQRRPWKIKTIQETTCKVCGKWEVGVSCYRAARETNECSVKQRLTPGWWGCWCTHPAVPVTDLCRSSLRARGDQGKESQILALAGSGPICCSQPSAWLVTALWREGNRAVMHLETCIRSWNA